MAKIGNQGDGGGRPPVVFDEAQTAQVEALAAVLSKGQMADYFGISETTLRQIEERQPEVSDAYKRGKAKAIGNVSSIDSYVYTIIKTGAATFTVLASQTKFA